MDTKLNIDVISQIEVKLVRIHIVQGNLNIDEILMAKRIIRSCRYPVAHCLTDNSLTNPRNTIARVQQDLNVILAMTAIDACSNMEKLLAKWGRLAAFWGVVVERDYTANYLMFMSQNLGVAAVNHDLDRLTIACNNAGTLQNYAINAIDYIKNLKDLTQQSVMNGKVSSFLPLNKYEPFMADIKVSIIAISAGLAAYGAIILPPQPAQLPAPQGPGHQ